MIECTQYFPRRIVIKRTWLVTWQKKKNKIQTVINKKKNFHRRQDAPSCYDLCTVCYVFKPKYILKNKNLFSGKTDFFEVSKRSSIDIDTKFDYSIAKILYKKNE